MKPLSSAELLAGPALREFIVLVGKDSVGKTCALVSLAWYVEQTAPDAKCYVIDTENKFKGAMRSFKADAPGNVIYYKCDNMNAVTDAVEDVLRRAKPYDWLFVESMDRIWEKAQDMGYQVIEGTDKAAYMEKRKALKAGGKPVPPVTPKPDQLWSVIKGAHDSAFVDLLSASDTLNVVLTTTIAKVKESKDFMKENADRKAARIELGMDAGISGAPRLPYYPETLCLLELKQGRVSCRVLRDNLSTKDISRVEFDVETRKDWGSTFFAECREQQ